MALFWSSLLTFYTRRQNGLLHVTDKAATAGNFSTTAAGSLSSSNFTSARRHRRLPSSDLKQVNIIARGGKVKFKFAPFVHDASRIRFKFLCSLRLCRSVTQGPRFGSTSPLLRSKGTLWINNIFLSLRKKKTWSREILIQKSSLTFAS